MFQRVLYTTAVVLIMCGCKDVRGQHVPKPTSVSIQVHGQVPYPGRERPAEFVLVRLASFRGGVPGELTNLNREGD